MKLTTTLTVMALAVAIVCAAAPAAAVSKQEAMAEMTAIFNELQSLRGNPAAGPRVAQLEAQWEQLRTEFPHMDPAPQLAASGPAVGNPPLLGVGAPVPPGCTSSTDSFPSTDTPLPVGPDAGTVTTSTLTVSGIDTYLWDVLVDTSITHTFTSDLQVTLESPAGTIVTLTSNNDGGNDDVYDGTAWHDDADPDGQVPYTTNDGLATDHDYLDLTTATPLVPEEAFAAFRGEDPNGDWVLTIADTADQDGGSLDEWTLNLITLPTGPDEVSTVFDSTDTPIGFPVPTALISSTLAVSGLDDFLSDVNVDTSITHTWSSDIQMTLESPAGTIVTLTSNSSGDFDDVYNGTTWDDDADPDGQVPYVTNDGLVTDHAYVDGVTATPLVPEDALAAFTGEDPNGDWVLTIADTEVDFDGGNLAEWSVELTTAMCGVQEADLEAVKSGVAAGGTDVTWTITVTNNGPGDATNVVVTDTLDPCSVFVGDDCGGMNVPPWTWNVGPLPANASAVCNVMVDASGCPTGPLQNTATVSADETDPVPANNDGLGEVVIGGSPLEIPTLDWRGLVLLLLAISLGAVAILRRRG